MMQAIRLPVIPIPGLTPDSLGNYLASLGLLRVLARKWPQIRIAWRGDVLQVVGGPLELEDVRDLLCHLGANAAWSPYKREWEKAQKESSKLATNKKIAAKSGFPLALWRANASEQSQELFCAHIVPHGSGRTFNPVIPKGGKDSKRDFSMGWERSVQKLKNLDPAISRKDILAFLEGRGTEIREKNLNAAAWFSNSNKQYNSGHKPYADGLVSPWAMVLACEGLPFLAGGASRRLGARSKTSGAFPFVTRSLAPTAKEEVTRKEKGGAELHDHAEFWTPIWGRPMIVQEVRALIARGRAEIFGEGARTPAAFAGAILHRGVDAGIQEFRRFVLGRTTSANTFEPRYEGSFRLPPEIPQITNDSQSHNLLVAKVIDCVLSLIERLPADRDQKGQSRFVGLRGPIEEASVAFAASPRNPEAARDMLDAVVASLDQIDRNRSFRAKKVQWKPLPTGWLPALFGSEPPPVEARLAMALVSGFPQSLPFTLYRFGVEWKYQRFQHPEQAPARWVWGAGELARTLGAILVRRTLDWEAEAKRDATFVPARTGLPARLSDVHRWLVGDTDDDLLNRWLARLALFNWRQAPQEVRDLAIRDASEVDSNGALAVFGLLRPLFDLMPLSAHAGGPTHDLLERKSGARTPELARALANVIRAGQIDTAVRMASTRYAMAHTPLIRTGTFWSIADNDRLLAAMLFAVSSCSRSTLIQPWLRPQRLTGETSHD